MAKIQGLRLDVLCEALGVERPDEVTRVVVDIRASHVPMMYVERMADMEKIMAGLTAPGIELRREPARPAVRRTCNCIAADLCEVPWHWAPLDTPTVDARARVADGPVVHGSVTGGNIAWGNGSVVQNGR